MAVVILFVIYVSLMVPASETVFWISFCIIFYTYAGYPILLLLIVSIKKKFSPSIETISRLQLPVTLVVAAFNEEDILEEKLQNCLSLDYPSDKLKIIFITDGSTDNSASILRKYPSVINLHQHERRGKVAAMNRAMGFVDTDFVVFSDANTILNRESIGLMMSHYEDIKVGGVAGEKKIAVSRQGGVAGGEGLYWKYESFIKHLDSQLNTVVGAAGELFSLRTALYTPLPEHIVIEDFVQSLEVCSRGYVVRYEPRAFAVEYASSTILDELERKTRISAGGFQAIIVMSKLFNVLRYPILSFQYLSHRVLRWTLAPLALIMLVLTSIILWTHTRSTFYGYVAVVQLIFYFAALTGWLRARNNKPTGIFSLPFYFSFMNVCVIAGFARFLAGNQPSTWKKAARPKKI